MSSAGMLLDGYQLTVIALAILIMKPSLSLTSFQSSLLIDSLILGTIVGAVTVGYLSDLFGRKRIYMFNLLFFTVFGLASIVTSSVNLIVVFRILMGISIGADYPVSNSYIAEMAPEGFRGKFLSFSAVAFVIGAVSSALVAFIFFYIHAPDSSWRYLIGIGLIPAVIVLIMRFSMPESRMWKDSKASGKSVRVRGMFNGSSGKFTILTSVVWFIYDMGAFGVGLLVPTILSLSGLKSNSDNALITTFFLIIGLIGGIIVIMLIDRLGRKNLQIVGFLAMGITLMLIPEFFFTALISVLAIAEFSNSFPAATVGIFPAELATTNFRSSAYGLAATTGKFGAVVGVLLIGSQVTGSNLHMFIIFGIVMLIGMVLTLLLPETRNIKLDQVVKAELGVFD